MSFPLVVEKLSKLNILRRFQISREAIRTFRLILEREKTISLFVDGTRGMGHQASSIYVLNEIIDEFEYQGTVTIVYRKEDIDGKLTIDKLAILIPELDPKKIEKVPYRGCLLEFKEFGDPSVPKARFGFTGGADHVEPIAMKFLQNLKVDYFLCLQPYRWPTEEMIIWSIDGTKPNVVDLRDKSLYGPQFARRSYRIKDPVLPSKEYWEWFKNNGNIQKQTQLVEVVTTFLFAGESKNIQLWPIYGAKDKNPMGQPAAEILTAIAATALEIQKDSPFNKPILILHLDPVSEKSIEELQYLINGGDSQKEKEFLQKKSQYERQLNDSDETEKNKRYTKQSIASIDKKLSEGVARKKFLDSLNAEMRITVIDSENINADRLEVTLTNLNSSANGVVFFQLGHIPPEVFQFLFFHANVPSVFEGQGTVTLSLNFGKPYIKMPRDTDGDRDMGSYPNLLLTERTYEENSISGRTAGATIVNAFYWENIFEEMIGHVSKFIINSSNPATNLYEYFLNIRAFYHDKINDKFILGIAALNYIMPKKQVFPLVATQDDFDLEALYETLLSNLLDGTLNLIPASLPEGAIVDFYKEFSASGTVTLHQAKVEAKRDGAEIIEIVVTGVAADFGLDLSAELKFMNAFGHLSSSATFKAVDTWSIEGIPWIPFTTPGFSLEISNGNIPARVSIFGTIQGPVPFVLSITVPGESNGWLLEANFEKDNYPSIALFYGLAGGIDLVQMLPSPLNMLSSFGLQKIEAIYDTQHKDIDYLLFVFSTSEPWELFPLLTVTAVEVQGVVQSPLDLANRTTMAVITGYFVIGQGKVQISTTIPGFIVEGRLSEGEIQLGDLVTLFLPGVELDLYSAITDFSFNAQPASFQYSVDCHITMDWDIAILGTTVFIIKGLSFEINHFQGFTSGSLSGLTLIDPEDSAIEILLTALYSGAGIGWSFEGKQTQASNPISIGRILDKYLHWQTEESYGINGLGVKIETQGSSYSITGKTAEPWAIPFPIGDNPLVSADFLVSYTAKERQAPHSPSIAGVNAAGYSGELSLQIRYYFIDVFLFYNFDPAVKKYGLLWGKFRGLIEQNEKQEWIGSVQLNNFTLGSMVETFISWATGQTFGLAAPWNLLDSINLNSFYLTFNFTTDQVAIHYNIGPINLGFAQIEALTLAYNPKEPNGRVKITLTGSFFWQDNPQTPISWDPTDPGNTPGPPGGGNKYIDLRLLALGQHVSIEGYSSFSTVEEAITAMKGLKEPAQGQIPIPPTKSIVDYVID